jgi:hypothetical protein
MQKKDRKGRKGKKEGRKEGGRDGGGKDGFCSLVASTVVGT